MTVVDRHREDYHVPATRIPRQRSCMRPAPFTDRILMFV